MTAWPPRTDDEQSAFVSAVEKHRLLAIAADDRRLPAALRERASRRYAEVAPAERAGAREQDELLARLPTLLPCRWIAVNGADLRTRLYASPLLRPMNDVDVLVRPEDVPGAIAHLKTQGFTLRPPLPASNDIGLNVPGSQSWFDLYPCLTDPARADLDYDEIWSARTRAADGVPVMAAHHLVASHALLLANMQFVTHARKLLDLWLLTRDAPVVERAMECARRWNIRRSFYGAIRVMTNVFPEVAHEPWAREAAGLVTGRERERLDRAVCGAAPYEAFPPRLPMVYRKFLLLDSMSQGARLLASHARKVTSRGGAP